MNFELYVDYFLITNCITYCSMIIPYIKNYKKYIIIYRVLIHFVEYL